MRNILGIFIILIVAILLAGCSSSSQLSGQGTVSQQTQTPIAATGVQSAITTSAPTLATTTTTTAALSSTPLKISGTGDDVVAFSATGTELRVFSMQYTGAKNFIVWLRDGQGQKQDLLANVIDSYSGKKSAKLTKGDYYLDVSASGPWTIEISPSVVRINPTSDKSPLVFSGSGDDVKSFTTTGAGLRIFSMQYTGPRNFIVWLKDGQGNDVDLLVNDIGSYTGKNAAEIKPGNYVLDISASGPWTIEIAS